MNRIDILRAKMVEEEVDLGCIPVQTHWPGDAGPLITWPVVLTRPHDSAAETTNQYNVGVYRAQVIGKDRIILRWLAHRGAAAHFRSWQNQNEPMPIAIVLGADPATLLSAALPLPESVSELTFAGVFSGARPRLVAAKTVPLMELVVRFPSRKSFPVLSTLAAKVTAIWLSIAPPSVSSTLVAPAGSISSTT